MQATLTATSLLGTAPASTAEALGAASLRSAPALPSVDSRVLLQGQKAVAIYHNGSVYRLQATKLGKLILTK